jgi:hypothetical protein
MMVNFIDGNLPKGAILIGSRPAVGPWFPFGEIRLDNRAGVESAALWRGPIGLELRRCALWAAMRRQWRINMIEGGARRGMRM